MIEEKLRMVVITYIIIMLKNYLIWRDSMSDISNFEFKKKFGQNFLKDNNVLNNIVEKATDKTNVYKGSVDDNYVALDGIVFKIVFKFSIETSCFFISLVCKL